MNAVAEEIQMTLLSMIELECREDLLYVGKKHKGSQFTAGDIYIASILRTGMHEVDNNAGGLVRFTETQIDQHFRRIG
jgi:hypothetical protein